MNNSIFRFPVSLPNSSSLRTVAVYLSGALFAIGIWSFIDIIIYSHTINASVIHVSFIDWVPIICSVLGMIIVSSLEKSKLIGDSFTNSKFEARIILFIGFALLAGGISGSIAVLILKFLTKGATMPTLWMGVGNVVGNCCVLLSCIVLWVAQNIEDEYSYSLAL